MSISLGKGRIGLGCMALTGIYGGISRSEAIAVVHRALDLGIDHFDTAELYGPYLNEELLAEALGARSSKVRIATKFGYKFEQGKITGLDSTPSSIRRSVDGSLKRLRRERIDLLYQHRADPNVPIEDVVGTMADLVSEGKIAALGLSSIDTQTLLRAQKVHAITAIQNEYSLIQRQIETDLLPVLEAQSINLVAFSPLGRGILSGTAVTSAQREPLDYRRTDARFARDELSSINIRLRKLWTIAQQRELPPAVVALAWLFTKSPHIRAIPGARTSDQILISSQASKLHLSKWECEYLDAIPQCE